MKLSLWYLEIPGYSFKSQVQVTVSEEYWTLSVAWIISFHINTIENCIPVWYLPLRKDNKKKESSKEDDDYGTGNPPCSEGLRDPDLLLRRSRPDLVTSCSTWMERAVSEVRGFHFPGELSSKGTHGRKLQLSSHTLGKYMIKQE